ncbi:hypothetical protein CSUI_006131 [Cystoisospora suis]|uniref:Transmembrane protein n=1 Tax=Cystoisospora suis TaxID=483139 RepID=A0A2C6KUM2_9APIC|nr:hypothetical protein CSUI_006131 [Cystoisospora suis]
MLFLLFTSFPTLFCASETLVTTFMPLLALPEFSRCSPSVLPTAHFSFSFLFSKVSLHLGHSSFFLDSMKAIIGVLPHLVICPLSTITSFHSFNLVFCCSGVLLLALRPPPQSLRAISFPYLPSLLHMTSPRTDNPNLNDPVLYRYSR